MVTDLYTPSTKNTALPVLVRLTGGVGLALTGSLWDLLVAYTGVSSHLFWNYLEVLLVIHIRIQGYSSLYIWTLLGGLGS